MSTVKTFQELEVWQLAVELDTKIYTLVGSGPITKDFSLRDQIMRSVGSIADNIAEGFGRGGRLELIQFLSIARASVSEVESQLIRAFNRGYFGDKIFEELIELTRKVGNKIGSFIK